MEARKGHYLIRGVSLYFSDNKDVSSLTITGVFGLVEPDYLGIMKGKVSEQYLVIGR